jgi:hypothetical protein
MLTVKRVVLLSIVAFAPFGVPGWSSAEPVLFVPPLPQTLATGAVLITHDDVLACTVVNIGAKPITVRIAVVDALHGLATEADYVIEPREAAGSGTRQAGYYWCRFTHDGPAGVIRAHLEVGEALTDRIRAITEAR